DARTCCSRSLKPGRLLPLTWSKWVKMTCSLLALPETAVPLRAATGAACIGWGRCRPATPRRRDLRCPAGCGFRAQRGGRTTGRSREAKIEEAAADQPRPADAGRVCTGQGACARAQDEVPAPVIYWRGRGRPARATHRRRDPHAERLHARRRSPEDGGGVATSTSRAHVPQ